MNFETLPEVLSPVGNREMLEAAVRSGADAVYFGAKEFSARRNAENFEIREIKEVIEYCHIRGVRAYLTLNILIKDSELEEAFLLAKQAYNMGIDGIIIQDLGLARILHEKIPNLKLHASTQMSVHSPSALPILKEIGFCQVVAAREMSKEELKAFCKTANELGITVEVFVHGALCMSMSGQCLLSAFLGSRSGNRGLCAGPCRLPFKVSGGTGYDLSLKDLSLLKYIGELYDMGVRSFKIEGRMKRPEYVAAATAACKQALLNGSVDSELDTTLKNVFSRSGFTDGYYQGNTSRDMFGIRTKEDVVSADKAFPFLHEIYRAERQSVGLHIKVEMLRDKPIKITFFDGENTVSVLGEIPQKAQKSPIDKESVQKNTEKLGSTPYFAKKTDIILDDGLFVSMSSLNALRRKACEELDSKRSELKFTKSDAQYKFSKGEVKAQSALKTFARFENKEQIPSNLEGIDAIIYPLEQNPEGLNEIGLPLIVDIPRGIVSEQLIRQRLDLFKKSGFKTALCGNLAAVTLAKETGFELIADTGLNITNTESLKTAKTLGIKKAVVSSEELISDITRLGSHIEKGAVVYGKIPLMLFRNCPLKNGRSCKACDKKGVITDRLGTEFGVRCRMGYSELLNSVPIWLADRKEDFSSLDFAVLYFTDEDKDTITKIISDYKAGNTPSQKYTRGLFYRGTI